MRGTVAEGAGWCGPSRGWKASRALPEKHAAALNWCYVEPISPRRAGLFCFHCCITRRIATHLNPHQVLNFED